MRATSGTRAVAMENVMGRRARPRLLAFERVLMGLVFLAIGVSGVLGLLPEGAARVEGGGLTTSLLAKAGFFFPLLKGAEVLLEQYLAASGSRS
jgi:hypothetical protein